MVMRHRRRLGGGGHDGRRDKKCVPTAAHTGRQATVRGAVTSGEGHKECVLTTAHTLAAKHRMWSLRQDQIGKEATKNSDCAAVWEILSFKTRKENSFN